MRKPTLFVAAVLTVLACGIAPGSWLSITNAPAGWGESVDCVNA